MEVAHTVLAVPDDILTVPAYYRQQFARLGIGGKAMMKHRIRSYTVPPVHASSEWIAHNAAMAHKRPILGQGKRPVIGALYEPRIERTCAVQTVGRHTVPLREKVKSIFSLVGMVSVVAMLSALGAVAAL